MKVGDTIFIVKSERRFSNVQIRRAVITKITPKSYYVNRAEAVFNYGFPYHFVAGRVAKESSGVGETNWKPVATFREAKAFALAELGDFHGRYEKRLNETRESITELQLLNLENKE